MHKIPVAGAGGFIAAIGIVLIAFLGLPIAKWFFLGALILGIGVVGVLKLSRRLKPRTEIEEVQLKLTREMTH